MNERGISKKLRFEAEPGEEAAALSEATEALTGALAKKPTSGQLGPKSTPKRKIKRRLRFDDEKPAHGVPPPEKPKSRLRFENEDTPDTSPHDEAAPHDLPKTKTRLHFEDEDTPNNSPHTTPATSGQVDPKLKQQSKYHQGDKSGDSSPLRHDDEAPALHADEEPPPDLDPVSTKGSTAKSKFKLEKSKLRMEETGEKLNNAREKLAAQKPQKPPGTIKKLGQKARFYTWLYVHKKISQVEHENVGTEAAHKTELAAEGVYRGTSRFVKNRIRTRPARRVRKLTKRNARATANHAYEKLLHDNPALRKKALARVFHKQRLKMRYAKQARQAAQATKQGGGIIAKTAAKLSKAAIMLVKGNPKVWLVVMLFLVLFFLLQSCMAMITTIGNSMGGVVVGSSFLAESEDISNATVAYTAWEAELRYRILHIEDEFADDFDEFRLEIGDISHNPFELVAFLTAVYNDFTYAQARATLYEIFNEQYDLIFYETYEIRTRIETRTGTGTGSWTDSEGETHEYEYSYSYEVVVEYEWHILYVTLESRPFREVAFSRMDEEQAERFYILMLTKGNRQYLHSPFPFNWLPVMTSPFGYRIHPIHGGLAMHWGIDIALPEGTEILSGQDGTVIFAGNAGGYGLFVVIDDGEGLVSRYAHCSVIYVTVGQVVSVGDVIARVGNTGDSTGPHLHLEIIKNGRHINPLIFTVTNHHLGF